MADFESLYWGSAQLNLELRGEIARLKQDIRDKGLTIDRLRYLLDTQQTPAAPEKPNTEETSDGHH